MVVLASACNLVDGLNSLQEVDCAGACEDAGTTASDAGADAVVFLEDAGTDAPVADGSARADADAGAIAISDAGTDASDGGDAGAGSNLLYIGCFGDSNTRDFPVNAYNDDRNTPTLCVSVCADGGYAYAAVQSANQCFCGNAYGGQGPSNGCTQACTGDDASICGGTYANSVYATAPQFLPKAPVYRGCFGDNGSARDLPYQPFGGDLTTVESCAAACVYHGYAYAGTEIGTQCFCGNAYGIYGTSLGCIDPCAGNSAETCGGTNASSVYGTGVDASVDGG